ncbi:MAG: arsenate reductase ArsC, partial [candidate division WOR-3 bacterium]
MKVLFLCVGNSCRSQMAEGFAKKYFKNWEIYSAGSKPAGYVHPLAVEVMKEKGIDISNQRSKGIWELPNYEWDLVVLVCSDEECPYIPGKNIEVWGIEDPIGRDIGFYRKVRDEIEKRVLELAKYGNK